MDEHGKLQAYADEHEQLLYTRYPKMAAYLNLAITIRPISGGGFDVGGEIYPTWGMADEARRALIMQKLITLDRVARDPSLPASRMDVRQEGSCFYATEIRSNGAVDSVQLDTIEGLIAYLHMYAGIIQAPPNLREQLELGGLLLLRGAT